MLRGTAVGGLPWGLISVGLAAPFLVGAERLTRWRETMPGATEALGFLAAGVTFFIGAAIPLELNREWITVAYAIELAAVAAISAQLGLVTLRQLCWPLLAIVVVRFVLNPEILQYPIGLTPIVNWMLWGYGISIAALVVALRFLRPTGDWRLVRAVEAAAALLAFVLLTLEVRSLFQPTAMMTPDASFMERAFYVLVWGAFALAALWKARLDGDVVALWAWRLSGGLAVAVVLVLQVLVANPVFEPADVGQLPIFNGLLLAYAIPAAMAALARRWVDGVERDRRLDTLVGAVASILAFAYVSFEVRHFFDPGFERRGFEARWAGALRLLDRLAAVRRGSAGAGLRAPGRGAAARRHGAGLHRRRQGLPDRHGGAAGTAEGLLVPRTGCCPDRPRLRLSPFRLRQQMTEAAVPRTRPVARCATGAAARPAAGHPASRLRQPGALSRQVRGRQAFIPTSSAQPRRSRALSFHRRRAICATPIPTACWRSRANAACACMPPAARPAGRPSSDTRRRISRPGAT